MELKSILKGIEGLKSFGNLDLDINMIECDSRKIKENGMFVAIKGFDTNGHLYIKQAIENGASAIMVQEGAKISKEDVNWALNI